MDCVTLVPDGFPLCRVHWVMVPADLRRRLLAAGRAGDGTPGPDQLDALYRAVAAAARRQGLPYRATSPRSGEIITSGIEATPLTLDLGLG